MDYLQPGVNSSSFEIKSQTVVIFPLLKGDFSMKSNHVWNILLPPI